MIKLLMNIIESTFFVSIEQILIVGIIVLIGQFMYASIGFGAGMMAISLYAILFGNVKIFVPFFLLLCLPVEIFVTYKDRKKIDFKEIYKFLIYITPAIFLGTYLLKSFSGKGVVLLLSLIIVALGSYYLFFEERVKFTFKSKLWLPVFGLISGIFGSMFGIAGPPLIIYFKTKKVNKSYFRVILLSIFLMMGFLKIISYSYFGLYTEQIFISLIPILPFSFLGLYLGNIAHDKISENIFKKITSISLLVSGLILMIKGLL